MEKGDWLRAATRDKPAERTTSARCLSPFSTGPEIAARKWGQAPSAIRKGTEKAEPRRSQSPFSGSRTCSFSNNSSLFTTRPYVEAGIVAQGPKPPEKLRRTGAESGFRPRNRPLFPRRPLSATPCRPAAVYCFRATTKSVRPFSASRTSPSGSSSSSSPASPVYQRALSRA